MATNHLKFWGVRALDLHDGTDKLVPHASEIVIALYNTTFDLILTGDRNGLVSLWNVKTGAQQFKFYCESVQVQIVKKFTSTLKFKYDSISSFDKFGNII